MGTFLVGYLIAAIALFPAPLFSETITVPRVFGMTRDAATDVLNGAGLTVGSVETATHPTAARGDVVWQDPPPGVTLEEGTPVTLTVSAGPSRVPVPDLSGYDAELAGRLIRAAGLRVERVDSTQAPVPRGVVVNTRPPAGATLLPGRGLVMVVSVGAPTITVPDLTGFTPEEAEAILQQVGLTLGTAVRARSSAAPPGTIAEQSPPAGTLAAPGRAINVTVAR
jgi:serine/threonine-protein kinase